MASHPPPAASSAAAQKDPRLKADPVKLEVEGGGRAAGGKEAPAGTAGGAARTAGAPAPTTTTPTPTPIPSVRPPPPAPAPPTRPPPPPLGHPTPIRPGSLDLQHYGDDGTTTPSSSPFATARPESGATVGGAPLVRSPRAAAGGVRADAETLADPGADPAATGTPRWGGRATTPAGAGAGAGGGGGGRGPLFDGIEEEGEGEEGEGEGEGGGGGAGHTVEAAGPPGVGRSASPPPGAPRGDGYDDMCGE